MLGPHYAVLVTDLGTGEEVYRAGARSVVPASTTKLLTSVAALESLGGTSRFTTSTRWQPQAGRLVLVGGGDPFLASGPERGRRHLPAPGRPADAGEALRGGAARRGRTPGAARLRRQPVHRARASTRPGSPATSTTSPPRSARCGSTRPRTPTASASSPTPPPTPPGSSPRRCAEAGVQVRGPVARAPAAADATTTDPPPTLASVRSATVGEIVERILAVSDNQAADVLAHHVGLAESGAGLVRGRRGRRARRSSSALGVPVDGDRLLDGSGLSRDNRLSPETLAGVLRLVEEQDRPELRQVLTGLPVAGFTGSLALRFDEGPHGRAGPGAGQDRHADRGARPGRGRRRPERRPDGLRRGRPTARRPDGELDARVRVDRIAAALGACRCGVGSPS